MATALADAGGPLWSTVTMAPARNPLHGALAPLTFPHGSCSKSPVQDHSWRWLSSHSCLSWGAVTIISSLNKLHFWPTGMSPQFL